MDDRDSKSGAQPPQDENLQDPQRGPETVPGEPPQGEFEEHEAPQSVDDLLGELAQLQNRLLRTQAEIDNVRKRARRDLEEQQKYAAMPFLRDLLPVVDNIDRAIAAAKDHTDAKALVEGFQLVADQLQGVLVRHHCHPIDAEGQPFDPHLHEAISQLPSSEHEPGTVMIVSQPGYILHDRVVRPSQVVVSAPPREAEAAEG